MPEALGVEVRKGGEGTHTHHDREERVRRIEHGIAQTLLELGVQEDTPHALGADPVSMTDWRPQKNQTIHQTPRRALPAQTAPRRILALLLLAALSSVALLGTAIAKGYIP